MTYSNREPLLTGYPNYGRLFDRYSIFGPNVERLVHSLLYGANYRKSKHSYSRIPVRSAVGAIQFFIPSDYVNYAALHNEPQNYDGGKVFCPIVSKNLDGNYGHYYDYFCV